MYFLKYLIITLPDGKLEQSPRVVILMAYADNVIMQHVDPHYGGLLRYLCIIGPPVSHLSTKYDDMNAVILVL